MRRILKIGLLCMLSGISFSQQFLPIQHDSLSAFNELIISGNVELSSTSIQNQLLKKLIYGGEITTDQTNISLSKHLPINRLGVDLNSEVEYRNLKSSLFKKSRWGYLIKGGYYVVGGANYSKDIFGLVFNGNQNYLGSTVDVSGSHFSFSTFQKIGFGVIDKKSKSSITLNFINATDFQGAFIQKGTIDLNADGTLVKLDAKGSYRSTQGAGFCKGIGVGLDIDYRFMIIRNELKKSTFQFVAKNIGFVNYFLGLQTYQMDSTLSFDGFKLNQLYGNQSVFKDSVAYIDSLHIQHSVEKKVLFLPGFLQFGKILNADYTSKWDYFYGIRLYPTLAYTPMLYLGGQWKPNSKVEIGTQASVGGFSRFRMGFYSNFNLLNWSIGLGSQDIIGMISSKGYGQSLLIRLRCKL